MLRNQYVCTLEDGKAGGYRWDLWCVLNNAPLWTLFSCFDICLLILELHTQLFYHSSSAPYLRLIFLLCPFPFPFPSSSTSSQTSSFFSSPQPNLSSSHTIHSALYLTAYDIITSCLCTALPFPSLLFAASFLVPFFTEADHEFKNYDTISLLQALYRTHLRLWVSVS